MSKQNPTLLTSNLSDIKRGVSNVIYLVALVFKFSFNTNIHFSFVCFSVSHVYLNRLQTATQEEFRYRMTQVLLPQHNLFYLIAGVKRFAETIKTFS